jgi:hypothetical protein
METIVIEGTPKTPSVRFDSGQGLLEIKGRSSPENSPEFYRPLAVWLQEYAQCPRERTVVNVQLEYFNTSSSKCLLDLFKKLEKIYKSNHDVVVNWYYEEDESMFEAGEDYKVMAHIPFNMIEKADRG